MSVAILIISKALETGGERERASFRVPSTRVTAKGCMVVTPFPNWVECAVNTMEPLRGILSSAAVSILNSHWFYGMSCSCAALPSLSLLKKLSPHSAAPRPRSPRLTSRRSPRLLQSKYIINMCGLRSLNRTSFFAFWREIASTFPEKKTMHKNPLIYLRRKGFTSLIKFIRLIHSPDFWVYPGLDLEYITCITSFALTLFIV